MIEGSEAMIEGSEILFGTFLSGKYGKIDDRGRLFAVNDRFLTELRQGVGDRLRDNAGLGRVGKATTDKLLGTKTMDCPPIDAGLGWGGCPQEPCNESLAKG